MEHADPVGVVPLSVCHQRRLASISTALCRANLWWLPLLPVRVLAKLKVDSEEHGVAVSVGPAGLPNHLSPTGRTDLLPLEPAFEAAKVEDVTAGQLLGPCPFHALRVVWIPHVHLLAADDARVLVPQFVGRGVRILVHFLDGLPISNQRLDLLIERACRHEEIADDVDRQTVEGEEDAEEGSVDA